MAERMRRESRECFVLHAYPYRETSLLVEVLSRSFGRFSVVARGARSPRSPLRGVLLAFQPLAFSWFGRGEVRTLAGAEWIGGHAFLQGEALLCGFYVNELLIRLLPREDPHEALFDHYRATLRVLATTATPAAALRSFERVLLKELGYAPPLEWDGSTGAAIDEHKTYRYDPEKGPVEAGSAGREPLVSGRTLLAIARDDYSDPATLGQAKALMRMLLNHRLDYQPLKSRQLFEELLAL